MLLARVGSAWAAWKGHGLARTKRNSRDGLPKQAQRSGCGLSYQSIRHAWILVRSVLGPAVVASSRSRPLIANTSSHLYKQVFFGHAPEPASEDFDSVNCDVLCYVSQCGFRGAGLHWRLVRTLKLSLFSFFALLARWSLRSQAIR